MNQQKNGILFFIIYAFTIPLFCIITMSYVSGFLQLLLFGIEGASPAIAAILTVMHKNGIKGVIQFLKSKYQKTFSIKLCILGFFVPAIILTVAKLLTYLTPYHNEFITIPTLKKVIILLWALIAEELGWRGYLQNEIEKRWGCNITPILVGLIWSIWHFHFFFSGTMEVPIVAFTYGCIADSYGYYIITKLAKGNIVPASIWHFSGNLFFNLYLLNPNWNGNSNVPYIILNIIMTVYIGIFIYYSKKLNH